MKKFILSFFILLSANGLSANDALQIKGKVYFDLYYVAETSTNFSGSEKNGEFSKLVNSSKKDESSKRFGFQIRRIYLTINKKISDKFSSRVRFETGNSSYEYNADKSMIPFVKDAYIKYKYAESHIIIMGISGPPTLKMYEEKLWKYRSVEKVPEDLYKLRSSRDFGISLEGKFGDLKYNFMIGNGKGSATEPQTYKESKTAYLGLTYSLTKRLFIQLYGDADAVWNSKDEKYTSHILIGYINSKIRIGLQYIYQDLASPEYINIFSVPFVYNFSNKFAFLMRFDNRRVNIPSNKNTTGIVSDSFFILGTDFKIAEDVHFIPNVEIAAYSYKKNNPDTSNIDAVVKFTVFYKY